MDDRLEHGERGSRVGGLLEARMISTSEIYHYVESRSNRPLADRSRLGGNVRTLRPSPKMIANPPKAPARVPLPIPPLEPISDKSSDNDDEHYEDMEDGDEEEEDEEENKVIEINEAREIIFHRVQQGSRAIRIKEMFRRGPARAPVVPPPRSDSLNMIHTLSNPQGSQPPDQDTNLESGLESGFENPLRIKGLSAVPFEAGSVSGVGKTSVEKGRWPNEWGAILRKPVPNLADGPNSYFLQGAASVVQRTADRNGGSAACSAVAHSKQYPAHNKTIGYSRLRAAQVQAQEVKVVLPSFSRTESEETITSLRRRAIPETDESEHIEGSARRNDDDGSWCNPVIHREDGLRSHPTSPQIATPTAHRAPTVPNWVKLGRPLPPLPSSASS